MEARAVKKKIQKILHKILSKKNYIFILKPNEEEQETEQFDMDMAVAEEYIEYYADKNKKLENTNLLCPYVNILIKINYTMP